MSVFTRVSFVDGFVRKIGKDLPFEGMNQQKDGKMVRHALARVYVYVSLSLIRFRRNFI